VLFSGLSIQVFHPLPQRGYRAVHRFGQDKFDNIGFILGSSQFLLLPQLQKTTVASKMVKIDSK